MPSTISTARSCAWVDRMCPPYRSTTRLKRPSCRARPRSPPRCGRLRGTEGSPMPVEIRMPQLGESVTEGTVVRWLKQPGEHVALDESLAEIETEKVNVEIPSPYEGTLAAHLVDEGATVDVGVPIATIEAVGAPKTAPERAPQPPI